MIRLHDKVTRGAELTAEERTRLEAWYAQQDREEAALLTEAIRQPVTNPLQQEVAVATAQLQAVTQRIAELTNENEKLRREIAALQAQLASNVRAQPA